MRAIRASNLRNRLAAIRRDQEGGTTLEWALLLGVIALPCYFILKLAFSLLTGYFGMMTTLNSLPFP